MWHRVASSSTHGLIHVITRTHRPFYFSIFSSPRQTQSFYPWRQCSTQWTQVPSCKLDFCLRKSSKAQLIYAACLLQDTTGFALFSEPSATPELKYWPSTRRPPFCLSQEHVTKSFLRKSQHTTLVRRFRSQVTEYKWSSNKYLCRLERLAESEKRSFRVGPILYTANRAFMVGLSHSKPAMAVPSAFSELWN